MRTAGSTRTQWPLVRLVATRLMLRDAPPSRRVRRLLTVSSVCVLATAIPIFAGVSSLVLVAVLAVASMVALATGCLRFFPPAMAVSVVGVALACASLMTALSVTTGFQQEIMRAMARLNGHVLMTKYGLDFFEYEALADAWTADSRVVAASPFAYSMVAVVGGVEGKAAAPVAERVDPDDAWGAAVDPDEIAAEEPRSGNAEPEPGPAVVIGKGIDPERARAMSGLSDVLSRKDLDALRPGDSRHLPGIVLGEALARMLGVGIGDHVRVVVPAELDGTSEVLERAPRHATFEVLDTFRTGTSEFDRNLALMHITAAQALFFREGRVTGIEFELTDPELAEEVVADMEAKLPMMYRLSTWRETNSAMLLGLRQIRATLSVVLGLMVVVAASSLIASLLLVVRRKRHDIAVLMAVGGDRSLMFWTFETVGIFAGTVGAVLGLALGGLYCAVIEAYHYPLGGDIYPVDHLPVVVRAIDALGPAAAAVVLCALASGPVAVLASSVGVIESLRR